MRPPGLLLACALALPVGCSTAADGTVRRGTPITHVQLDYGVPDVIADRSGSESRCYLPTRRPAEEWPADAPPTFCYLGRDVAVTFVYGKAVRSEPIDPERRERILLPLVRRGIVSP